MYTKICVCVRVCVRVHARGLVCAHVHAHGCVHKQYMYMCAYKQIYQMCIELHDFRYSVGRILGDGNFAVVRGCVCRKTKEEYALKIIDKAKCRGKEHMIESEVSILRRVCIMNSKLTANHVHLYFNDC